MKQDKSWDLNAAQYSEPPLMELLFCYRIPQLHTTTIQLQTVDTWSLSLTLWMSVTAAWALLSSLQARITRAPLLARSSAVALPIPVFAPGNKPAQMSIISIQLLITNACVWRVNLSALARVLLLRCVTRLNVFTKSVKSTKSVLKRLMIKMKTCKTV